MSTGAQTVSGPGAGGGRRRRLARPAVLFWWPVVLLGAFAGGLWLLAPGGHESAGARTLGLPEPGAAYVRLPEGAQSLYLKLDIFTSPSGLGFGRTQGGLDAREMPASGVRIPPEFLPAALQESVPLALSAPRLPPPRLFDNPADMLTPMMLAAPGTNGVHAVLSPGLSRAAFAFELPRTELPPDPGGVRCHVELDDAGRVSHLLIEKDEAPIDAGPIEAAVGRGRGTGPARGTIEIVWTR